MLNGLGLVELDIQKELHMASNFVKFIYSRALKDSWDLGRCYVEVVFSGAEPIQFIVYRDKKDIPVNTSHKVMSLQGVINEFSAWLN